MLRNDPAGHADELSRSASTQLSDIGTLKVMVLLRNYLKAQWHRVHLVPIDRPRMAGDVAGIGTFCPDGDDLPTPVPIHLPAAPTRHAHVHPSGASGRRPDREP
jgi:hypothetical protein